jgi:anthranilate/para-aminobenzoate synthase component I
LGDRKYFWHFSTWFDDQNPPVDFLKKRNTPKNPSLKLYTHLAKHSNETENSFVQKIKKIQKISENGEIWVLNLAHKLSGKLANETSLLSVFYSFLRKKKDHCGGVVWTSEQKLCSLSPEIFLTQKGKTISTFPIKGTGNKVYLEKNQKEISELAMVTDLLRNDFGQIANRVWMGRERILVPRGEFWDAHAEIFAELSQNRLTWEMYKKMLPAGSISGAPKARVTDYILQLENFERSWYTGTFGVKFSQSGSIFNILIRTFFVKNKTWEFPVGAGITYESDAHSEWKETLQKAEILRECGG